MIKYDPNDWQEVTSTDDLSDGEIYFVSLSGDVIGLMTFDGSELSNDEDTIDLDDHIPSNLFVMEMSWPSPPEKL